MLFAYLSDSDSVNVTSVFEMYPIGWLALEQRLARAGLTTGIVNVASLMLGDPTLDVDALLRDLRAPVFGFDLHWMAQCHGSIELARLVAKIHPGSVRIFGGISATYYAEELARYDAVDVVVRGYDTLAPVTELVSIAKRGSRDFRAIPNLLYTDEFGTPIDTGFTHQPSRYSDETVDWSFYRDASDDPLARKLIMTLPNSGCAYDCGWCGGSRYATTRIMRTKKSLVRKPMEHVKAELHSMSTAAPQTSIYALGCYSEGRRRLFDYLDTVKSAGYRAVSFEQFNLPDDKTLIRMAESSRASIMLSPESHDPRVSRLAGRGTYTMAEMEAWIPRALDLGIASVIIWFFIGMPEQDRTSVLDTVDYAVGLMKRFEGKPVVPLICPMVPFLDPGSRFFEEPQAHGYRLFARTLEAHRQALVAPLWHQRLNYETRWLGRREIQSVTYESVARLVRAKADSGLLAGGAARRIVEAIDETTDLLDRMERALELDGALAPSLRQEIRVYNGRVLSHSSDQLVPYPRPFGGRWFDDFTVSSTSTAG